jgi:hypothetical protein
VFALQRFASGPCLIVGINMFVAIAIVTVAIVVALYAVTIWLDAPRRDVN